MWTCVQVPECALHTLDSKHLHSSPHLTNLSMSLFCCLLIIFPNSPNEFSSRNPFRTSHMARFFVLPLSEWFSLYCSFLSVYLPLLSLVLESAHLWWEGTRLGSRYPQIMVCKVSLHWVKGQQNWPANYMFCPLTHELHSVFWGKRGMNFYHLAMVPVYQHLPFLGNVPFIQGLGEPCTFVPLGDYSCLKRVLGVEGRFPPVPKVLSPP